MADLGVLYISTVLITISILISGIAIGIGRAIGQKKVEDFGYEELTQSIINGALIGGAALIISTVSSLSADIVKNTTCSNLGDVDAVSKLSCLTNSLTSNVFLMLQETTKMLNILGYYQTLNLNFGPFSIQPLINLQGVSSVLSSQLFTMNVLLILLNLQQQILNFISKNAMLLIFPLGLALRTVFATRKLGGFLISVALALFILYPVFLLMFPTSETEVVLATNQLRNFTNNSYYATTPIVDLNNNGAIAQKIDMLSGKLSNNTNATNNTSNSTLLVNSTNITSSNTSAMPAVDMTSDITKIIQLNSSVISRTILFSIIAPLFSLIISIVFIKELGNTLGGEIMSISVLKTI